MVNMDYRYSLRRIQKFVGHMTSVNLKINLQKKKQLNNHSTVQHRGTMLLYNRELSQTLCESLHLLRNLPLKCRDFALSLMNDNRAIRHRLPLHCSNHILYNPQPKNLLD